MSEANQTEKRGLMERLEDGPVVCAGGYLFEMERRGYLQAGTFVPEVVLEHPEVLAQLHREFIRAGSDVLEAFTYYAHREKLRIIGKEDLLEPMNREAIRIAKSVAAESGGEQLLVAGNICNTNAYDPNDPSSVKHVRGMFEEMVGWAVEEGVDFILAETLYYHREARIALDVIRESGLPSVVTLGLPADGKLLDGVSAAEAARRLEDNGADVVGLNCYRGPATMLPALREVREAVSCHVAALPVTYRTTPEHPTFFNIPDEKCPCELPGGRPFPTALDPLHCNRYEISEFTSQAHAMGVNFLGICCGNAPHYTRSMAEALGRRPPASKYSPDMSKHIMFGTDGSLKKHIRDSAGKF